MVLKRTFLQLSQHVLAVFVGIRIYLLMMLPDDPMQAPLSHLSSDRRLEWGLFVLLLLPHPPLHNLGGKPSLGNVAVQAETRLHSCVIPRESPHKLPCIVFCFRCMNKHAIYRQRQAHIIQSDRPEPR